MAVCEMYLSINLIYLRCDYCSIVLWFVDVSFRFVIYYFFTGLVLFELTIRSVGSPTTVFVVTC